MRETTLELRRSFFTSKELEIFASGEISVSLFRYDSGVEALRIKNSRGHIIVLPFMGQMIWDVVFDGVCLTMENMFSQPLPVKGIVETYGCFAYHSGILRNGCPSPEDTHPLHGEMPCAPMDRASIVCGEDKPCSSWKCPLRPSIAPLPSAPNTEHRAMRASGMTFDQTTQGSHCQQAPWGMKSELNRRFRNCSIVDLPGSAAWARSPYPRRMPGKPPWGSLSGG